MFEAAAIAEALRNFVWDSAPVLALGLDENLCVTAINAQSQRVLPATTVGQPLAELLVAFNRPDDLAARIRQPGAVHRFTISTASGMPETLGFRFFPLPGGTLAVAGLDFAEQQQLRTEVLKLNSDLNNLTRQLHQTNAELRELNQLKNQFLGMAAHDLRAPVGLLISYNEFVLEEAGETLSAEHRGFLQTCRATAEGMKQLIENFLDVAVIESGQLRLECAPVTVAEIIAGVRPLAGLIAGKKQIELIVAAADEARTVGGDAAKLQQVLVNFISNAVQHSVPGQRVWLTVRGEPTQLIFAVRDEGQGLSPAEQARLFASFARAGTKKTAGERSTGLGLAIARQVIAAHGGRIWVESEPGHGATFLFALPIQETTQPTEPT